MRARQSSRRATMQARAPPPTRRTIARAACHAGAVIAFLCALAVGSVDGVRAVGRSEARASIEPDDVAALAPDVAWASAPEVGARARLAVDETRGGELRVV